MSARPLNGTKRDDLLAREGEVWRYVLEARRATYEKPERMWPDILEHAAALGFDGEEVQAIIEHNESRERYSSSAAFEFGPPRRAKKKKPAPAAPRAQEIAPKLVEAPPPAGTKPARRSLIRTRPVPDVEADSAAALEREPIAAPRFLLADVLTGAGAGILGGSAKSGKTWFLLLLAVLVASGAPEFLGLSLLNGPVLFISFELSRAELKERISRLLPSGGWPPSLRFRARGEFPNAASGGLGELRKLINRIRPVLVVLDTFGAWRIPASGQNIYLDDYRAADELRALGLEFDCMVLAAHHTGKAAKGVDPGTDLIGTTGLAAGVNVVLGLRRMPKGNRATLTCIGNEIAHRRLGLVWDEATRRWTLADAAQGGRPAEASSAAEAWLREQLAGGPRKARELEQAALDSGICSLRTLNAVKKAARISSSRQGREWVWALPAQEPRLQQ